MRHHAIGLGPSLCLDDAGRKRVRMGRLRVPFSDPRLIGMLFAGGIVLACIPIPRPGAESFPGRLARSGLEAPTLSIVFSPNGKSMATTHADGRVAIRDVASGWSLGRFFKDRDHYRVAAYSPDGNSLALGGVETDIVLCDLRSDAAERRLGMPVSWTTAIAFSPDGRPAGGERSFPDRNHSLGPQCRTAVEDLAMPNVPDDQPGIFARWPVIGHRGRKRSDDHHLGPRERPAPRWNLLGSPGPRRLARILARRPLTGVSQCSPKNGFDSGRRARADCSGLVADESPSTNAVAFSPDGCFLATADGDGTAGLWCVETGRRVGQLDAQSARLTGRSFSPDGQNLAAIGVNHDIRFWDVGRAS